MSDTVTEIMKSIRWAKRILGRPPAYCEVGWAEWQELLTCRPVDADPGWRIQIMGVPVRPLDPMRAWAQRWDDTIIQGVAE